MLQLKINTSQNVNIVFTAATLGDRIVAFLIDLGIMIVYCWAFSSLVLDNLGLSRYIKENFDNWSAFAINIIIFSPIICYSLILETIFQGQSFGKMIRKLKVVKIDGYQASFGDYLIRWFTRLIDIYINLGIIAIFTILWSKKSQRLGDMAAGTSVIKTSSDISINHTILQEIEEEYVPVYLSVIKLSDNDVRIIKDTFEQAAKTNDNEIISKLCEKVESIIGTKNQGENNRKFIRTVLKDYNYYTQTVGF